MKSRNALTIAVTAVIILACLVAVFATQDDRPEQGGDDTPTVPETFPTIITDEMRERPPVEDAAAEMADSIETFTLAVADGDAETIADAVYGYVEDWNWMLLKYELLYIDYNVDPYTYGDEYVDWTSLYSEVDADWTNAVVDALEGEHADAAGEAIDAVLGEGASAEYLASGSTTPDETELLQRETELTNEYYAEYDPEKASWIMLELIDVRNRLAELNGYDTYADYAYSEIYHRDYAPEDTMAIKEVVKEHMIQFCFDLVNMLDQTEIYYSYEGTDQLYADASPFIHSISDEFGELYDYMVDNGMIDFEDVPTKTPNGYTLAYQLNDVKLVYIIDDPVGGYTDMNVLVHEFGHAAAAGLNERWTSGYDIMEVQSQGMEALLALSPLNPIRSSGEVSLTFLVQMLNVIVEGCIYDDFQQRAYVSGAETPEDLDRIFDELEFEYGIRHYDHWTSVPHTFDRPFYYISYATSGFSALGIFADGITDYDGAVQEYLAVNRYTGNGYLGMIEDLGLYSFFEADDLVQIMDAIASYLGMDRGQPTDPPAAPALVAA